MENTTDITLLSGAELAQKLGFSGLTAQFRVSDIRRIDLNGSDADEADLCMCSYC